ncbi:glutathione S-transferase family protein [Pigmentiphaga aceris]|uniref:Glutathione S-transferase family protein n=1 Tax=Pigmentiphaga aceris TaxID=1940612 RepID=A0A5C0ATM2_9BURK|nr:glutathione S-transferase family protein [Pigmentiphaga aceris]QEI04663.1 glutathione S-transferase family protein [Pigmentiphaga aceris]
MNDELVFYMNPQSRARIVRWMLEEVGQPYRAEQLDYRNSMKTPEYLAINPMGKVPAITHRGVVVTECAAICAYLADAFPQAGLAPALNDPQRGPYYRWMFFAAGPVEACVTNQALGVEVPADKEAMVGYGRADKVVAALEHALSTGDYLLGDRFSAADVYVGSQLGWSMMFGTLPKKPVFERYWERLSARPAAIRAKELDDALIAAQKAGN